MNPIRSKKSEISADLLKANRTSNGMKKDKGFISWLILIIIALALLKYFFNWSIFDAIASEQGRSTINYIREVLNTSWSYIKVPVMFIWQKVQMLFEYLVEFI